MARRLTKAEQAAKLQQCLRDKNYDPVSEILRIAQGHNTKQELRLKIAMDLLPYVYAKKKAVEMDVQSQPVTFNIDLSGADNGNEVQDAEPTQDSTTIHGLAA